MRRKIGAMILQNKLKGPRTGPYLSRYHKASLPYAHIDSSSLLIHQSPSPHHRLALIMPMFTILWFTCCTGIWVCIAWRCYRIGRVWLTATGVVEAHGKDGFGEPLRRIRILDGPHANAISVMYLEEYAQPSRLPVGTTVSVRIRPLDASTCTTPLTDRFILDLVAAYLVVCIFPVGLALWFTFSTP